MIDIRMFLISRENISSSALYCDIIYILHGSVDKKSVISSFFTQSFLFDFMSTLSFLLFVFQYLAKHHSSHISLSIKFTFLCPFLLFPHYFTKFSYQFLEFLLLFVFVRIHVFVFISCHHFHNFTELI